MNISNTSKIYTFSKEIANMIEKNSDYDPAKTTVYWPPIITLHPIDMNAGVGRTVKFIIDAEPGYTEELNYQWYKQAGTEADIDLDFKLTTGVGYTTKQYTTTTLTVSNDGDKYYCVVWNMPYYRDKGYAYTNPGTVNVIENANYCVEREIPEQNTTNEYIFERLQEAFDFAKDDDNIRVLQNVSEEPNATLNGKKKITFTNDGKTLNLTGVIEIGKDGEVTMNGSGTITKDNNYMIENKGKLTINNSGLTLSDNTGFGIITKQGSTLDIVSGTISTKTNAIYAENAVVNIKGDNAKLTVSSSDSDAIAIYMKDYTKVNIEKGSVEATNTFISDAVVAAVYNDAKDDVNDNKGRVVVSGGTVKATGVGTTTGDAIVNTNSADAHVTGGTVTGSRSAAFNNTVSKYSDIVVKAGTLTGGLAGVINNSQSAKVIVGVEGGGVTDETPTITGSKVAIFNASKNDTFEFYDGKLVTSTNGSNSVIVYESLDNQDLVIDNSITDMIYTENGRYEIVKELGYDIFARTEGVNNIATLQHDLLPELSEVQSQAVTEGDQAVFSFTVVTPGHPDVYEFEWQVSRDNGATWNKITTGVGIHTTSYKTTPTTIDMDGNCFRCVITSAAGTTYTNIAKLTVYEDISNVDQKPIVRVVYKNDLKQVRYEGTTPCVDMQIIVKSFAEVNSILLSFAGESNKEIYDLHSTYSARDYKVSEMTTTKVERVAAGTTLYEYTYTYDLTAYTNGLITVKAANEGKKDGTATQTIDIIQSYKVTYELSPLSSYNDKVLITFISSRKVEPYSSSVGAMPTDDYRKLQSMDGGVYSYRYTYRPDGAMPETKFVFRDDTGNEASCTVHSLTRTEYNDVKFSPEDTSEITDLNIVDAFNVAKDLEGVIELNENQDAQSRYGLIKSQVDVEMAKPRDVGAVNTLSNADGSKTFDGIYIRNVNQTQSYDSAYDYVRDDKNNYVAAASGLYDTELSNEKGVDNIVDSRAYTGANISGFDQNNEERPYMYISTSGSATNIDDEIQDASFRAIIFEN
jgi:hypothetical protein